MSTSILTRPAATRRLTHVIVASTAVFTLASLCATTPLLDRADAQTHLETAAADPAVDRLPSSADAAERWLAAPAGAVTPPCRPDAAERWQIPNIARADLPYTADAAERWLTPEFDVRDLPYTADAAERWLCAP